MALPTAETMIWARLVARGRLLEDGVKAGTIELSPDKGGKYGVPEGPVEETLDETPASVRKWVVYRTQGLGARAAFNRTGIDWATVREAYLKCRECRWAFTAMHEDSRHRMREMAYEAYETALDGGDVTKHQMAAADRVLAAQDAEHFAKPADRCLTAGAGAGGGGVTIMLVDVSKGYRPPAIACTGDGDEGVTV